MLQTLVRALLPLALVACLAAQEPPAREPKEEPKDETNAKAAVDGGDARASAASATNAAPLRIERGDGEQALIVPRDEELRFDVTLNLGALGSPKVGVVTITSRVTPFYANGVLTLAPDEPVGEQASVVAHAVGEYALYQADQTISTLILPQAWPNLIYRSAQSGTENRQREQFIGVRDGVSISQHRSDGHCRGCEDRAHFMKPNWVWQDEYHCAKCKRPEHRMWRAPETHPVPERTLDMVAAVVAARSMVLEKKTTAKFTLLDKEDLWIVDLSLGKRERRKVKAGTFDAVEVKLVARPPEGAKGRESDFEGLFGLHGSISIWMQAESGVPIEVRGSVPAGPLELDVAIELTKHRGTPAEFLRSGTRKPASAEKK